MQNADDIDEYFSFLSRGIILWIELLWPENPVNTYARHTDKEYGCNLQDTFGLIGRAITMNS